MSARVLVAMSGGVDSSVAACVLMQQGYECAGATMLLYDGRYDADGGGGQPANAADARDARAVCDKLGIQHHLLDMQQRFEQCVIAPFVHGYQNGLTPNPCLECNKHLKFGAFLQHARELGFDYIATGHYARVVQGSDGRWGIQCGIDQNKDQSYVLYALTQERLEHVLLPLGGMTKDQVRSMALQHGLVNARKGESQDICFVPDGDYRTLLQRFDGSTGLPGDIVDSAGNVLGRHTGLANYTIGQRKGLGVAAGYPLYVCRKNASDNTVVVGPAQELLSQGCLVGQWNWMAQPVPADGSLQVDVKTNYRQQAHPATLHVRADGFVQVTYERPSRRDAAGQAAVAYVGDRVVGGGTIVEAW